MKAISAPRTGVDATDRAERGLDPFATLGCPIYPRHPYLPKGAKGGGVWWSTTVVGVFPARSGLGSTAADGAERGLDPFATLGCPICPRHHYLPKGAKGGRGVVVNYRVGVFPHLRPRPGPSRRSRA